MQIKKLAKVQKSELIKCSRCESETRDFLSEIKEINRTIFHNETIPSPPIATQ